MLDRVARADPALDDLTNMLTFRLQTHATSTTFSYQLEAFCEWFSGWNDTQRNALLNVLEEVDQIRVYEFIDRFKALRHS